MDKVHKRMAELPVSERYLLRLDSSTSATTNANTSDSNNTAAMGQASYAGVKMPFGEATTHGWHILPDVSHGYGPILAVLEKLPWDASVAPVYQSKQQAKKQALMMKKRREEDNEEEEDEDDDEEDDEDNDDKDESSAK